MLLDYKALIMFVRQRSFLSRELFLCEVADQVRLLNK